MDQSRTELFDWFSKGEPRIGVIGLGYVGLPLSLAFVKAGLPVTGFDVDAKKCELLLAGDSYLTSVDPARVRPAVSSGMFDPTTDFAKLADCNAILICVPTPLGKAREPDLKYVTMTCDTIVKHLKPGQLVVLESTTYPGTTDEVVRDILESKGLKACEDFYLAFSPEREDPGNPNFETSQISKLVGGIDEFSGKLALAVYQRAFQRAILVSSAKVAESAKLLENIYRSVNIALVNEMKIVLERMGIDIWEVVEAAATKPFGFQAFYPGPGLGGHCIPIDPFYLTWKAAHYGVSTRFIELAGEINSSMPEYVIHHVQDALNDDSKALKGSRILVLGAAYKHGIGDTRESPSLTLIEMLSDRGAEVDYNDPIVPNIKHTRKFKRNLESISMSAEAIASYDCVLLVTTQPKMPLALIAEHAKLIVDTRNAFKDFPNARVRKA